MVNRFGVGEVYSPKFTSLQFEVRGLAVVDGWKGLRGLRLRFKSLRG